MAYKKRANVKEEAIQNAAIEYLRPHFSVGKEVWGDSMVEDGRVRADMVMKPIEGGFVEYIVGSPTIAVEVKHFCPGRVESDLRGPEKRIGKWFWKKMDNLYFQAISYSLSNFHVSWSDRPVRPDLTLVLWNRLELMRIRTRLSADGVDVPNCHSLEGGAMHNAHQFRVGRLRFYDSISYNMKRYGGVHWDIMTSPSSTYLTSCIACGIDEPSVKTGHLPKRRIGCR